MRRMINRIAAGKFTIESWDEGHGMRAYLMVNPTCPDGRMYWDCTGEEEMNRMIDEAISDLQYLRKNKRNIFDNMH